MRRAILIVAFLGALLLPACALAKSVSASAGGVTATLSYSGGPGPGRPVQVADLYGDGSEEVALNLFGNGAFCCEFAFCAGAVLPLQVLEFNDGRFVDITRQYPKLIAAGHLTQGFVASLERFPATHHYT